MAANSQGNSQGNPHEDSHGNSPGNSHGSTSTATTAPYSTGDSRIGENTVAELRELAARYPQARSALLPMLHLVQSVEGRITPEGIEVCAGLLGLTGAEVSAVATFYTMYKRRPVGDYHVGVCTNTLCAVMGGDLIFERLQEHLGVGNDETTEDGKITLEHIECNAACDYAPVMMVNWEFFDDMTPESATRVVDDLRSGTEVQSPRGARICTWREAERVLAGFPDGRADEGPAGGEATLVGLRLARERNWTAPDPDRADEASAQSAAEDTVSAEAAAGPRPEDQPGKESGTGSKATEDTRKED